MAVDRILRLFGAAFLLVAFADCSVADAQQRQAVAPPPANAAGAPGSAPATPRFDGIWDVVLLCPTQGTAAGYTLRFSAQVRNGVLHGENGIAGQPGWLAIDGTLKPDGTSMLRASGLTNNPQMNVAPYKGLRPGTRYSYGVQARLDDAYGSGSRTDGVRTCNYTFSRLR